VVAVLVKLAAVAAVQEDLEQPRALLYLLESLSQ
jgi:hypothetical protein